MLARGALYVGWWNGGVFRRGPEGRECLHASRALSLPPLASSYMELIHLHLDIYRDTLKGLTPVFLTTYLITLSHLHYPTPSTSNPSMPAVAAASSPLLLPNKAAPAPHATSTMINSSKSNNNNNHHHNKETTLRLLLLAVRSLPVPGALPPPPIAINGTTPPNPPPPRANATRSSTHASCVQLGIQACVSCS